MGELQTLLTSHDIHVICATETQLNDSILDAEVSLANYNMYREDRESGSRHGGSAIFVHKGIKAQLLPWFKGCESVAVRINTALGDLTIVCLYRSPSLDSVSDNSCLLSEIGKIPTGPENNVIIVSDINLPHVNWNSGIVEGPVGTEDKVLVMEQHYLDLFSAKGFRWYLSDRCTRRRLVSNVIQESLLDQVFTNNDNIINDIEYLAPMGKSDHVSLKVGLKIENDLTFINSKRRNWHKVTSDFILQQSDLIDWHFSSECLSVEEMWCELSDKLNKITESVPESILKSTRDGEIIRKLPWDSSALVRRRKEKDQSWRVFDENPSMVNFNNALFQQSQFQKCEVNAKIKYENKLVKSLKNNSKPFFNYLRSKSKIRKSVSSLKCNNGELTKSPKEAADKLADFFQSVFSDEIYGPLPKECYDRVETSQNIIMSDLAICPETVANLLRDLDPSKSMGPDKIHPKLLKTLATDSSFVNSICGLFEKCIAERSIPQVWKTAEVVPLHKKGSIHLPDNYRPVSLTCVLCKVYEKILRQHMLDHIENSITDKQHGFVSGRSCLSNLLETVDIINEYLAEGNCADVLYFDFSKAFDSVSHYRLLIKMENFGISQEVLDIVRNFLIGRTMAVKVGDAMSSVRPVMSGVPQGSVLGPLLFLLFINDLPENIKNSLRMFADDVKFVVGPGMYRDAQSDLYQLSNWESLWGLRFNIDKCKVLHFGRLNPETKYLFGDNELKSVDEERDLGVLFDASFNFKSHIASCISKANQQIGWITRSIISRQSGVMLRVYKTLIRPFLEYCCQVWSPKAKYGNWATILEIEGVQRSFTRIIDGLGLLTYRERLEKLGLTTLLERRMRGDLIEVFKIVNDHVDYGSNLFNYSSVTKNIRAISVYKGPSENMNVFSQRVIMFWNRLPRNVKSTKSVNSFKNMLDAHRQKGYKLHSWEGTKLNDIWELSWEIFDRLDINPQNRLNYTTYMREHPTVARRRGLNITI